MENENNVALDQAVVSFEDPKTGGKIVLTFTEFNEGIDMKAEVNGIDEHEIPTLNGKLALLFMDFCSKTFGEVAENGGEN